MRWKSRLRAGARGKPSRQGLPSRCEFMVLPPHGASESSEPVLDRTGNIRTSQAGHGLLLSASLFWRVGLAVSVVPSCRTFPLPLTEWQTAPARGGHPPAGPVRSGVRADCSSAPAQVLQNERVETAFGDKGARSPVPDSSIQAAQPQGGATESARLTQVSVRASVVSLRCPLSIGGKRHGGVPPPAERMFASPFTERLLPLVLPGSGQFVITRAPPRWRQRSGVAL